MRTGESYRHAVTQAKDVPFQYLPVLVRTSLHRTSGKEPSTLVQGQFHNPSLELTGGTVSVVRLPESTLEPSNTKRGGGGMIKEGHRLMFQPSTAAKKVMQATD